MMKLIIFSIFICLISMTVLAEGNPTSSELAIEVGSAFILCISKLPKLFFVKVPLLIVNNLHDFFLMLWALFQGNIKELFRNIPLP